MALLPSYLLLGPEAGEKAEFLARLRKEAGPDAEESRLWASDTSPDALASILMNGSLFASSRLVVYSGVEALSTKAASAPIVRWLSKPSADTVLVMLSDEASAEKSLRDAVGAAGTKVFWELFEERKEEWVRSWFRKAGVRIDGEAVEAIVELVEGNTEAYRIECARLAAFVGPEGAVTGSVIETWLSHNRAEDAFSLFDRMAEGRYEDALESLEKMLYSREGEPIGILAGLQWCFRRLEAYHANAEAGMGAEDALLKAGIKKIKWKIYRQAARVFPPRACQAVLSRIVDTDSLLRSSGGAKARLAMQLLIRQAMKAGGRRVLSFDPPVA